MIVYLITAGSYSDYNVYGVSLDRDDAYNQLCKLIDLHYDNPKVETRDTDILKNVLDNRLSAYDFQLNIKTGEVERQYQLLHSDAINECGYYNTSGCCWGKNTYKTTVFASDYDHALKIARDRLAEYKAEKEGII